MFLPRAHITLLYQQLKRSTHAHAPPVLVLVALDPDALCACRILTALFRRDYLPHQLVPVAGYADLLRVGRDHVRPMRAQAGGPGGTVVCLGVGGLVDLGALLGLEETFPGEDALGGVVVWVMDARRPWNLGNVFDGAPPQDARAGTALPADGGGGVSGHGRRAKPEVSFGEIQAHYSGGRGGVIVFDDGNVAEELQAEREAYFKLLELRELGHDSGDEESDGSSSDGQSATHETNGRKRKSWSGNEDEDDNSEAEERPRQRRRSASVSQNSFNPGPYLTHFQGSARSTSPTRPARRGLLSAPQTQPAPAPPTSRSPSPDGLPPSHQPPPAADPAREQRRARRNRRQLRRLRRRHRATLLAYYARGASYAEPVASLAYALAAELGRETNDALWYACVGVASLELYGRTAAGVGLAPADADGDAEGPTAGPMAGAGAWGGGERVLSVLRDEVRRLNPPDAADARVDADGVIPTTARGPADTAIRLSPEPRFLLVRHWSLYESMLHSPYLAARLQLWHERGVGRLDKLLASMGVSLGQSKQGYRHMSLDIRRGLRRQLLQYAPRVGLPGLVPAGPRGGRGREGYGFVRCWGWKACLSATDVGVIVGAMLEIEQRAGPAAPTALRMNGHANGDAAGGDAVEDVDGSEESDRFVARFFRAYDALENIDTLLAHVEPTQALHRAILRTGTHLLVKRQMRALQTYRVGVVHDGPDVALFAHPGALTKLALWVAAAQAERDRGARGGPADPDGGGDKAGLPLVLAALNERRGCYVVVGTGSGGVVRTGEGRRARAKKEKREKRKAEREREKEEKRRARREARRRRKGSDDEDDDDDEGDDGEPETETESEPSSDDDSDGDADDDDVSTANGAVTGRRGVRRNRFGLAFQDVVRETGARVRIDSFEHCVVEVRKEDLKMFLEALSHKSCVG